MSVIVIKLEDGPYLRHESEVSKRRMNKPCIGGKQMSGAACRILQDHCFCAEYMSRCEHPSTESSVQDALVYMRYKHVRASSAQPPGCLSCDCVWSSMAGRQGPAAPKDMSGI